MKLTQIKKWTQWGIGTMPSLDPTLPLRTCSWSPIALRTNNGISASHLKQKATVFTIPYLGWLFNLFMAAASLLSSEKWQAWWTYIWVQILPPKESKVKAKCFDTSTYVFNYPKKISINTQTPVPASRNLTHDHWKLLPTIEKLVIVGLCRKFSPTPSPSIPKTL